MRLYTRTLAGAAVILALCGFFLSGCSSAKVVDTVKFWDEPKSQRIQPKRYDGKENTPAESVQAEAPVAQTTPPETGTQQTPAEESATASDEQLSPAERKLQERVDKRAEAIRAKHRTQNSFLNVF